MALAGSCGACGENGARWNQEVCTGANLPGRFHTQLSFYRFRNSSTGGKGLRLWATIGFAVFRVRQMGDGGALDVPICDTRVRSSMTHRRRWARMRCAVSSLAECAKGELRGHRGERNERRETGVGGGAWRVRVAVQVWRGGRAGADAAGSGIRAVSR